MALVPFVGKDVEAIDRNLAFARSAFSANNDDVGAEVAARVSQCAADVTALDVAFARCGDMLGRGEYERAAQALAAARCALRAATGGLPRLNPKLEGVVPLVAGRERTARGRVADLALDDGRRLLAAAKDALAAGELERVRTCAAECRRACAWAGAQEDSLEDDRATESLSLGLLLAQEGGGGASPPPSSPLRDLQPDLLGKVLDGPALRLRFQDMFPIGVNSAAPFGEQTRMRSTMAHLAGDEVDRVAETAALRQIVIQADAIVSDDQFTPAKIANPPPVQEQAEEAEAENDAARALFEAEAAPATGSPSKQGGGPMTDAARELFASAGRFKTAAEMLQPHATLLKRSHRLGAQALAATAMGLALGIDQAVMGETKMYDVAIAANERAAETWEEASERAAHALAVDVATQLHIEGGGDDDAAAGAVVGEAAAALATSKRVARALEGDKEKSLGDECTAARDFDGAMERYVEKALLLLHYY